MSASATMASRITVLARNLPPLRGGMERLGQLTIEVLAADHACRVFGPPGATPHLPATVQVEECRGIGAAPFLADCGWRLLRATMREPRPDLVLATSGLLAPLAWAYARLVRCPYAVVVHGLDLVVEHRAYQALFVPRLRGAARVLANSAHTAALAVARGVRADAVRIVHPGVVWPVTLADGDAFRVRHGLGRGPLLLSVGRLTRRKGVAEFIRACLPALRTRAPGLRLVVIGAEATQAVRREGAVSATLAAAIAASGCGDAVHLLGGVDDAELAAAYAAADVHVFPVREVRGDVEGFGMVAAEAAAHGLPSVAFAVGGVPDAVVADITGSLVPGGDYAAFGAAIRAWLPRARDPAVRAACRVAARRYDTSAYAAALTAALADLLPRVAPPP